MSKDTFIKELECELIKGGISKEEIKDTCNYYRDYFLEKVGLGYKEKDILEELGEPRLIAKTIIDTANINGGSNQRSYTTYTDSKEIGNSNTKGHNKVFTFNNKIIIGLMIFAFIALVILFSIFAIKIFIFCLPVIIVIGIIRFLLR